MEKQTDKSRRIAIGFDIHKVYTIEAAIKNAKSMLSTKVDRNSLGCKFLPTGYKLQDDCAPVLTVMITAYLVSSSTETKKYQIHSRRNKVRI